ncbi:MAG TPA: hypothetical protein VFE89_18830 [Beijerinckiaceae bacterium]|nr:hypothetical protein [Beijerinckiaceae bacterium]
MMAPEGQHAGDMPNLHVPAKWNACGGCREHRDHTRQGQGSE